MKRVLAVHDLSCMGSASLGVAIPILNALGCSVTALPSVLLSSTTDIDPNPLALSTTDWMRTVVQKWVDQSVQFDAIYTGWLGNPEQVKILKELISVQKNALVCVDPVLGDCGKVYPSQKEMIGAMKFLAESADIITPNPTEAVLLLGGNPDGYNIRLDGTIEKKDADELAGRLTKKYPNTLPIITSVIPSIEWSDHIGVCIRYTKTNTDSFDDEWMKQYVYKKRCVTPSMGGTGDLFASLLVGFWLRQNIQKPGEVWEKSIIIDWAVNLLSHVITHATPEYKHLPFQKIIQLDNKNR